MQWGLSRRRGREPGKSGKYAGSSASTGGFLKQFLLIFSYTSRQKAASLDSGHSNTKIPKCCSSAHVMESTLGALCWSGFASWQPHQQDWATPAQIQPVLCPSLATTGSHCTITRVKIQPLGTTLIKNCPQSSTWGNGNKSAPLCNWSSLKEKGLIELQERWGTYQLKMRCDVKGFLLFCCYNFYVSLNTLHIHTILSLLWGCKI